ncbi:MAG: ABC transporter substrate-binding protein [Hyphomicrobiales bacterium]|nr:MAG: ABC transporter substrate-binding protein [Hyphomicrobiales bacterium]
MTGLIRLAFAIVFAVLTLGSSSAWAQKKTLRFVPHSDVKILDPIWTTAYITRNHGYMVYDTLFAMDAQNEIKPQMLETYEVSGDGLIYTLVLRDGLLWHDGTPVTADDCVASLKRWSAKDAMGQTMMTFVASLEAKDAKTIVITLKQKTGLVLQALGKPSSNVPFMMPKRVAETDPNKQIADFTGSGPFVFKRDEWQPGAKLVYTKFEKYKPRSEPASGFAGGKVVKVDRVEWLPMPDLQQAVNALLAGEIDYIEAPPHDLHPLIKGDSKVYMVDTNPLGNQFALRFNTLAPPFDNPKVRQAVFYALNQEDFLKAVVGTPEYYKVCKAMFICGTPFATEAGMEDMLESNMAKAKALLKEAGYDGTPIVLMHSTDLQILTNLAPVAKSLMEKAGFKVDMQSMDWQTLIARRVKKDAPKDGGWHAFLTSWVSADLLNPTMSGFLNASCEKAMVGWPCDAQIEQLRDDFAKETDLGKQKEIAALIQKRVAEYPTHIHLGQWYNKGALRNNVQGVVPASAAVLWNISID